jgi:hypothetical protein
VEKLHRPGVGAGQVEKEDSEGIFDEVSRRLGATIMRPFRLFPSCCHSGVIYFLENSTTISKPSTKYKKGPHSSDFLSSTEQIKQKTSCNHIEHYQDYQSLNSNERLSSPKPHAFSNPKQYAKCLSYHEHSSPTTPPPLSHLSSGSSMTSTPTPGDQEPVAVTLVPT